MYRPSRPLLIALLLIPLLGLPVHAQVLPARRAANTFTYLPVTGKIEIPKEFKEGQWYAYSIPFLEVPVLLPQIVLPANLLKMSENDRTEWFSKWQKTDTGRALRTQSLWIESLRDISPRLPLRKDGSFYWYNVPPGNYTMTVSFFGTKDGKPDPSIALGVQQYRLNIYQPDNASASEIDLKTLKIQPYGSAEAGQTATDFPIKSMDGRERLLSDLNGKVVLLDFWGTWCGGCVLNIPTLQKLHDKHKANPKFEIISIDVDDRPEVLADFLAKTKMPWTVVQAGGRNWAWAPQLYSVSGYPTYWIIGPDRKVIASGHEIDLLIPYIDKALSNP